ncbi:MAG: putative glycosyl hydrolase [Deltaproteobacteria bacterium]|nr:putative glycosyl hydrolase [Deltaproteobacteria bacterium]
MRTGAGTPLKATSAGLPLRRRQYCLVEDGWANEEQEQRRNMKRHVAQEKVPSGNVSKGQTISRATVGVVLALVVAILIARPSAGAAIALRAATPDQRSVPRYGKLELTLDLEANYTNPFDPAQIDVYAVFVSPEQQPVRVYGFLFQPFRRRIQGGAEQFDPAGPAVWKIRFAPDTVGTWHYQVFAQDRTGRATLPPAAIDVTPSAFAGFIRRSDRNPRAFAYEDGHPFFPVGENMAWAGRRGTLDYDDWLAALSAAGGNWIRIWMASWNCALEWSRQGESGWQSGDYSGAGFYSLRNAWKLDTILDLVERYDMKAMVTFGTYGEFTEGGYFNEGQWKANPYRAANGGPCAQPEDFWTNAQARSLYRQRLRYLMARYAYRTSIHAWEFWNEAKAPASWVVEMASYLKGTRGFAGQPADPYQHLLTTTYGTPDIWRIPEIDLTQTHRYGEGSIPDHAPLVYDDAQRHRVYGTPHLMSEFGIDFRAPDGRYDPDGKGVNLHNALWASALSGNAGSAMVWWWDNYVHPSRVYAHFSALRQFVESIPWTAGAWEPLEVTAPSAAVYGLILDSSAMLWAHNPQHHWRNVLSKKPVAAMPSQEVRVRGLPSGRYTIEWWDTWKGGISRRESVTCREGRLTLRLPELETDVAARIVPADSEDGTKGK